MAQAVKVNGTGRRKSSVARVYLTPGKGNIIINKRSIDEYFGLETLKVIVRQPLTATETADKIAMIAITTTNSTKVKPFFNLFFILKFPFLTLMGLITIYLYFNQKLSNCNI